MICPLRHFFYPSPKGQAANNNSQELGHMTSPPEVKAAGRAALTLNLLSVGLVLLDPAGLMLVLTNQTT